MVLTCGGSKTVVPRICGAEFAGAAGAAAAADASTRGAGWLAVGDVRSSRGAVHPAAINSAPMTTAVRRMGDKRLLDIEISVQISRTACAAKDRKSTRLNSSH